MHLIEGASEAFYTLWTRIEAGPSQKQSAHQRNSPAPFLKLQILYVSARTHMSLLMLCPHKSNAVGIAIKPMLQ